MVNAAEGEPGTFKDRTILPLDPYAVLEGALIAALVVGADTVVDRDQAARSPRSSRGCAPRSPRWRRRVGAEGVELERRRGTRRVPLRRRDRAARGRRRPLPVPTHRAAVAARRRARSWRRPTSTRRGQRPVGPRRDGRPDATGRAARPSSSNVETFANVARIVARGAEWFRTEGTESSPGTIVCTITGATQRAGVGEVIMGTPLARGHRADRRRARRRAARSRRCCPACRTACITGPPELDTPLTYEDLSAIGGGLGSAGFIVFDDVDRHGRGGRRRGPLPRRRVVRPVHAVQAGRALARRPPRAAVPQRRRGRRRSTSCAGASPPSPTAPVATWPPSNRSWWAASSSGSPTRCRPTSTGGRHPSSRRSIAELRHRRGRCRRGGRAPPRQAARLDLRRDGLRRVPRRPARRAPRA